MRLDDETAGPVSARELVRVELARPFFDAETKLAELCSDNAVTPDAIDVHCVTGSQITRVVVKRAGDGFDVTVDGRARPHWKALKSDECYALHGVGSRRDLEATRAAWGRDTASERCGAVPRTNPVHVVLDFADAPGAVPCEQRVVAVDADAIVFGTSDMGVENRYAYRLGDHLYALTDGDVLESTELPCGAKVTFDVRHARATVIERADAKMRF